MKMNLSLHAISILSLVSGINGFAVQSPNSDAGAAGAAGVSRRESFAKVASIVGGVTAGLATSFPNAAIAYPSDETPRVVTRMGGLLVSDF